MKTRVNNHSKRNSLWHRTPAVLLATLLAGAASGQTFYNGNFQTGDLTGWTTFTTANGTLGPAGFPDVTTFNTGAGASSAAQFNVGELTVLGAEAGGGIMQDLTLTAGTYQITANIAAQDSPLGPNAEFGIFSLLVDGVTVDTVDFGSSPAANAVITGNLTATFGVSSGVHDFEFLMTRHFLSTGANGELTPDQYLDNIIITPAPEPSTLGLLGLGALALLRKKTSLRAEN